MKQFDAELKNLVDEIVENKHFNEENLAEIKDLITRDRKVSLTEASLIVDLKNAFEGSDYPQSFFDFYVDGITSFLLYSGNTPGSLDTEELVWLRARLSEDGTLSDIEKALLKNIALRAEGLPHDFHSLMSPE